jgi:hypothetical protein
MHVLMLMYVCMYVYKAAPMYICMCVRLMYMYVCRPREKFGGDGNPWGPHSPPAAPLPAPILLAHASSDKSLLRAKKPFDTSLSIAPFDTNPPRAV